MSCRARSVQGSAQFDGKGTLPMSSLTMFRKSLSASNMAKLLFGVLFGVIITPVQADEPQSLEERLEQLEQRVIDNEKWLASVGRSASGYEKSWTMSDVSDRAIS